MNSQTYRCPKCSQLFHVNGVLCRHIMEKHPELAELIIGEALDLHFLLGQWGE